MISVSKSLHAAFVSGELPGGIVGTRRGYVATSATTSVLVRATAFTDPGSAQQLQMVSANANDSSAGTGTRTVRITYYDGSMNGPFTEDVTMNGTTAVNTVATNMRFIESIESLTVGSNGTNVGVLTLRTLTPTTVGTIAASDGTTFWAHHFVAANKTCFLTRLFSGNNLVSGLILLYRQNILTANAFETQIMPHVRVILAQPSQMYDLDNSLYIPGPAIIVARSRPDAATASTSYVGFSFLEF